MNSNKVTFGCIEVVEGEGGVFENSGFWVGGGGLFKGVRDGEFLREGFNAVVDFFMVVVLVSLEAVNIFKRHTESDKVVSNKHIFTGVVRDGGFEVMEFSILFSDPDESGFILGRVEVFKVDDLEDFIPREEFFVTEVVSDGSESEKVVLDISFMGMIYNRHKEPYFRFESKKEPLKAC